MRFVLPALVLVATCVAPAVAVDKKAIEGSVDRGVAALRAMQQDGTWTHTEIGATALAGMTLLECGVDKEDKAIQQAVTKVREAGLREKKTYSLALSIMFLDKYDDPRDTPLIESLIVRLIGAQAPSGGWGYDAPDELIVDADIQRIKTESDPNRVLKGGRDLSKLPAKGKRKQDDLPKELQDQLVWIGRGMPQPAGAPPKYVGNGDNSNTQFGVLGLWVGRRYGVPVQGPLLKAAQRFRISQNADGGWSYVIGGFNSPTGDSSAAMTCAGILGLAVGHGAALDVKRQKDAKIDKEDISKDLQLKKALAALSTAVGEPTGWDGLGPKPAAVPTASGRAHYYLWSLERVGVVLGLETIGKKDWYNWGAEVLLASQDPSGAWTGEHGQNSGVDTCFALLFLKKVNVARDLTASLTNFKDVEKVLRAGGIGGKNFTKGLASSGIGAKAGGKTTTVAPERPPAKVRPVPKSDAERAAHKLVDVALRSKGAERAKALEELRSTTGPEYTDGLLIAIRELDPDGRKNARDALASRMERMKSPTLKRNLKDSDPELRRATALAIGNKEKMELVPDLIDALDDSEGLVVRAAHAALRSLSGGKDFGPKAGADEDEVSKAKAAWRAWWKKNQ